MTRAEESASGQHSWQWFEDHADHYEDVVTCAADFGRQLVDFADPRSGTSLLDVGSGQGAVARAAVARGCVVTAVDIAPAMVKRLAADAAGFTVRAMDASRLDFPSASFTTVTAGYLVDVLDDPVAAVTEIRRVLRPGGLVALSVQGQIKDRWLWLAQLAAEFWPGPAPVLDVEAVLDVRALLTGAGFVELATKEVESPVPIPDPGALWNRLMGQVSGASIDWLPPARAAEFRARFLAEAERMHASGGIVIDRSAIFRRAKVPGS